MKVKYVMFHRTMSYDVYEYAANTVYEIEDANGYVERWIKRGCEVIDKPEVFLDDPRGKKKPKELAGPKQLSKPKSKPKRKLKKPEVKPEEKPLEEKPLEEKPLETE